MSNSNNKEILKLNINHYKYQKNIKSKGIQNNFKSYLSKNPDYNDIIHSNSEIVKNNKSYLKTNKLYLPYISDNIIRKRNNMKSNRNIGCIVLTDIFFIPRSKWIKSPEDWNRSIVRGKTYKCTEGIGKELKEIALEYIK